MFRFITTIAVSAVAFFALSCQHESNASVPESAKESEVRTSMDKERFWAIIEASANRAKRDRMEQMAALRDQLKALSPEEIVGFQCRFDECLSQSYRWDLWGAAYVIAGGCSDDGFLDFRAWLISRGEKVYDEALKDPETLSAVITESDGDCQFEEFQYVASEVWEERTGKDMSELPRIARKPSDAPAGQEWSEEGDDLKGRFPKLWKRFASH